jgi:hypothetical protein
MVIVYKVIESGSDPIRIRIHNPANKVSGRIPDVKRLNILCAYLIDTDRLEEYEGVFFLTLP